MSRFQRSTALSAGLGLSLMAACAFMPAMASAQAAASTTAPDEEVIVVTGFRASLASAIDQKRRSVEMVDVIMADDIAKFPDLNLAESLQRIPGVEIDRDGGEGRQITVRGLSPDFIRVRLNGLEALATTGGSDTSGGSNRSRSFDFSVFASELFNSVTVRKTQTASVDEGSLGATVDLRTAHPFDYQGPVAAFGVQSAYNDLNQENNPRATFLLSDRFWDGHLGVLVSGAWSSRNFLEEGTSTGRWRIPLQDGATTIGATRAWQSVIGPITTANGTVVTGAAANTAVLNAAHPRIPRYGRIGHDRERFGGTASIQLGWTGGELTFDSLYASLKETRTEAYLENISMARETAVPGMRAMDVVSGTIDAQNNLIAATFNDVDVRSEFRRDNLHTTIAQNSLELNQQLSPRLHAHLLAGYSRSVQRNPMQTTISFDRFDVAGYSYNYADPNLPVLNYGFDVSDPSKWGYIPATAANGSTAALGDASLVRIRPNRATNSFLTFKADFDYDISDDLTLRFGGAGKVFEFEGWEARRLVGLTGTSGTEALPQSAATLLASNGFGISAFSQLVTGYGRNLNMPAGNVTQWLVPDIDKLDAIMNFSCNCVNSYGDWRTSNLANIGETRSAAETSSSFYVQLDFQSELASMPVRGSLGVREVETNLQARGYSNLGGGFQPLSVSNTYHDTLPTLNLSVEARENLFVRFAAAKTMSRPQLSALTPGGSFDVSPPGFSLNAGNPFLNPIRANAYDFSVEYYPWTGAQFSVAYFRKDIGSYIQRLRQLIPFSETGYPTSILPVGVTSADLFDTTTFLNTPGGRLTGYEVTLQTPFNFLPAPFDGFGGILNYTETNSAISYILAGTTIGSGTVSAPLVGQSPRSASGTIYYEHGPLEARVSVTYRDPYLTLIPAQSGNDVEGKQAQTNVDASMTYRVGEHLTFTLEGINLTDQFDERYINSVRENSLLYQHTGREVILGVRYRY